MIKCLHTTKPRGDEDISVETNCKGHSSVTLNGSQKRCNLWLLIMQLRYRRISFEQMAKHRFYTNHLNINILI